jgi:NADH-quinone oxidoreductase subunit J
MNIPFFLAAAVALATTIMVITRRNAVHALLYFIVSLFSVAVIFLLLGAPFVAALEIIIYAGAIMVLFVFVVMLIGAASVPVTPSSWIGPSALGLVLFVEIAYVIAAGGSEPSIIAPIGPKEVGIALMGPYLLGAEVAAFILLSGLVGAFHLGRRNDEGDA